MSDLPEIYIMIIEDHHIDVDARPFTTLDKANEELERTVRALASYPDDPEWDTALTESMLNNRWCRYVPYGPEGDSARILRRQLDAESHNE